MSNQDWKLILLSLAMGVVVSAPSFAQRNSGRQRGSRDVALLLIASPNVQQELSASPLQIKLIEALQTDLVSQFENGLSFRSSAIRKRREVNQRLCAVVLDEKQNQRFSEVRIQFEGLYAIERKELAEKMKLTNEQKAELSLARSTRNRAKSTEELLAEVLDEEQQQIWKELAGMPFTFSDRMLASRRSLRRSER